MGGALGGGRELARGRRRGVDGEVPVELRIELNNQRKSYSKLRRDNIDSGLETGLWPTTVDRSRPTSWPIRAALQWPMPHGHVQRAVITARHDRGVWRGELSGGLPVLNHLHATSIASLHQTIDETTGKGGFTSGAARLTGAGGVQS
jgi:hypothetical protein